MKTFGLIGYPLGHSFSKKYFKEKFKNEGIIDTFYDNFPLEKIEDLTSLIAEKKLNGLNVTIPYKEQVLPFLDEYSDAVKEIHAVNTIVFKEGKLYGHNTDVYGFEHSLRPLLNNNVQKALILGTGGASKAIAYVLNKLAIEYLFVSRNPSKTNQIAYSAIDSLILKEYHLIVNTSPVGTYPNEDACPDLPYELLTENYILYDLVYNPEETLFMKNGKQQGAVVKNGYEMLVLQAEKSWEIWNE